MRRAIAISLVFGTLTLGLAACEDQSDVEESAEEVQESVEDVVEETGDAAEEAAEAVEDEIDENTSE
jgi:hypothetical protein